MSILVIRFSSVGDIVLAGAVTRALGPVSFLTLERYSELAALLPGVTEVRTWESMGRSSADGFDTIVDLHCSPRSRWTTLGNPATVHRIARHDLKRRARVHFKTGPAPSVLQRYAVAAGTPLSTEPWHGPSTGEGLLLVPGAAHPTKQWPLERFVDVALRWKGPVTAVGGPSDADSIQQLKQRIPGLRTVYERGFVKAYQAIRECSVAVGGDTGLMHLAEAAGLRTVPLFGPTHSSDGFWPRHPSPIEVDLSCRPCSRHGRSDCPVGDHQCMQAITPDRVWQALSEGDRA